ncbi:MAG: hypothetical protein IPK07_29030 [Deltaproteobacteria bacterium]|nr:hypothetical protein [Deltaproteobacteria bacterium]
MVALVLVTVPVAIECHLEMNRPEASLHGRLQARGFLPPGPIAYEPGHGFGLVLGMTGAAAIVLLALYSVRKRVPGLSRFGRLPRWLDAHVTLGLVGPMLVLFHTAGRLGGIISVAFWSMVVVVTSGVIGRYVYAQVPRTIAGRERSLGELGDELAELESELPELATARGSRGFTRRFTGAYDARPAAGTVGWFVRWIDASLAAVRERRALDRWLTERGLDAGERDAVLTRVRRVEDLERQVAMLESTRRWVARWHAMHVPLVGLLYAILVLHVAVGVLFGAR